MQFAQRLRETQFHISLGKSLGQCPTSDTSSPPLPWLYGSKTKHITENHSLPPDLSLWDTATLTTEFRLRPDQSGL